MRCGRDVGERLDRPARGDQPCRRHVTRLGDPAPRRAGEPLIGRHRGTVPPRPAPSAVDDHAATAARARRVSARPTSDRVGRATAVEVAHGPRQLEHPVVAAQRERAPLDRPVEVDGRLAWQPEDVPAHHRPGHLGVDLPPGAGQPLGLRLAGPQHPFGDDRARLPGGLGQRGPADRVHLQLEVDPVQQRPHQLAHVVTARPWRAGAVGPLAEPAAAGARVGGEHELEPGGVANHA